MGKDLFKRAGFKYIGPGGLRCQCCDNHLSKKRKSKVGRNLFSRLRRSVLKNQLVQIKKELDEESK